MQQLVPCFQQTKPDHIETIRCCKVPTYRLLSEIGRNRVEVLAHHIPLENSDWIETECWGHKFVQMWFFQTQREINVLFTNKQRMARINHVLNVDITSTGNKSHMDKKAVYFRSRIKQLLAQLTDLPH